jgi:putative FmdB family regulatory protein
MPIYDFQCPSCQVKFEKIVAMDTQEVPCPDCESMAVRPEIAGKQRVSFRFNYMDPSL